MPARALRGGYPVFNKLAVLTACFIGLGLIIWIFGHYIGIAVFMFVLMYGLGGERIGLALVVTAVATAVIWGLFEHGFNIELYRGLLFRYLAGYRVF